jgi:catechol 2,3-dioxygenase-like lactoylglutathione lyase family enzyme
MSLRALAFEGNLFAITLVSDDLEASANFYGGLLGLALVYEDDNSAIYKCGETMINLLKAHEAVELAAPDSVGSNSGVRAVYTLRFADIDALAADLVKANVPILSGPIDRPWGVRTLSIQDPSGHTWEFANH